MAPPDQNSHPRQSLRLLMPRAAPYQAIFRLRGPSINHLGLTPNPLHEFRQDEHTRLQRVISVPAWPLLPDSDRRHPIDGPCQCSLRRQPVAFVRLEIRESHAGSWVQSLPLLLNDSPRVCFGNSLLCSAFRTVAWPSRIGHRHCGVYPKPVKTPFRNVSVHIKNPKSVG